MIRDPDVTVELAPDATAPGGIVLLVTVTPEGRPAQEIALTGQRMAEFLFAADTATTERRRLLTERAARLSGGLRGLNPGPLRVTDRTTTTEGEVL